MLADDADPVSLYLWLQAEWPRREPSLDGEDDGTLSVRGLDALSGSAVDSLDSPGNRIPPLCEAIPSVMSPCDFRKAADPSPLSAVCLNHVGSFEPSD